MGTNEENERSRVQLLRTRRTREVQASAGLEIECRRGDVNTLGFKSHRQVKSRLVVSFRLLEGGGSGGQEEFGAGGLDGLVEDVQELAHGDVGEVAAFAVGPFLVLLLQHRADQTGDGVAVGEDLDDVGAAFDLRVQTLDRGV